MFVSLHSPKMAAKRQRDETMTTGIASTSRPSFIHEYSYTMNNTETGHIFLLDSPDHPKLCSWHCKFTNLRTIWHGSWTSPVGDPDHAIDMFFDYIGRPGHAVEQKTSVTKMEPKLHGQRLQSTLYPNAAY